MRNCLLRLLVRPDSLLPGPDYMGHDFRRIAVPAGHRVVFDRDDMAWRIVPRTKAKLSV